MSEQISFVLDASGAVIAASLGPTSSVTPQEGQTALAQDDAPDGVWIGWRRLTNGTWSNGVPVPAPQPAADLLGYAHEAHLAAEARGTTWDGWPVAVNERALTRALGEVTATLLGARSDTDPWTYGDGVSRPLSNTGLQGLSLRIRRHIGVCLAVYNQVAVGISAGAITTTAQVDGAFGQVDAIVLQAAA